MKKQILAVLALLVVTSITSDVRPANGSMRSGMTAPNFEYKCGQGHLHRLTDLRGKVVVIDFWASWCRPCLRSLPELQRLHDRYSSQGVVFLGVNDEDRNTRVQAERILGLKFFTIYDENNSISNTFRVDAIPRTLVLDTVGRVVGDFTGLQRDNAIERAILEALSGNS